MALYVRIEISLTIATLNLFFFVSELQISHNSEFFSCNFKLTFQFSFFLASLHLRIRTFFFPLQSTRPLDKAPET